MPEPPLPIWRVCLSRTLVGRQIAETDVPAHSGAEAVKIVRLLAGEGRIVWANETRSGPLKAWIKPST